MNEEKNNPALTKDEVRRVKQFAHRAERYSAILDAAIGQMVREKLWAVGKEGTDHEKFAELLKQVIEIRKVEVSESRSSKRKRPSAKRQASVVRRLFGSLPPVTPFGNQQTNMAS